MGLFDMFRKKDNRYNHVLTDEERELSIQTRRSNAELKQMQNKIRLLEEEMKLKKVQMDYQDLLDRFEPEEEEPSGNNAELAMLMGIIGNARQQSQQVQVQQPTEMTLTDEQIVGYIEAIPKAYRRIGKNMSDEQLMGFINAQMPHLSQESKLRAITIFRNVK